MEERTYSHVDTRSKMLPIISVVVGFIVVLFASLLKNVNWNPKGKLAIATVLSVIGGIVAVIATGGWAAFAALPLFESISMVFTASQLLYKFILDGTKLESNLAEVKVLPGGTK